MGRVGFIEAPAVVKEIRSHAAVAVELPNGHFLFVKVPKEHRDWVDRLKIGDPVVVEIATSDPTKGFLIRIPEKGGENYEGSSISETAV